MKNKERMIWAGGLAGSVLLNTAISLCFWAAAPDLRPELQAVQVQSGTNVKRMDLLVQQMDTCIKMDRANTKHIEDVAAAAEMMLATHSETIRRTMENDW